MPWLGWLAAKVSRLKTGGSRQAVTFRTKNKVSRCKELFTNQYISSFEETLMAEKW